MSGEARIMRGDARQLQLPDNSVDLVVTSPPYFALRSYKDGGEHYDGQIGDETTLEAFINSLLEVTKECMRVLKPSGSLWVNLGDKYAGSNGQSGGTTGCTVEPQIGRRKAKPNSGFVPSTKVRSKSLIGVPWRYALRCIDDLGLILRAEVIWAKPNGLPESVTDRVARKHEQWFHFTLNERYYAAVDEIREAHNYDGKGLTWEQRKQLGFKGATRGVNVSEQLATDGNFKANPLGKLPGSVWTVATEPLQVDPSLGVDHFAAFPSEFPRRIILGWCPPDGVVLDPFGGTGTTAAVAKALKRIGISNDMSADYCRLADWRCNGAGFDRVWAKVHNTEPVKRDETQLALFDDTAA